MVDPGMDPAEGDLLAGDHDDAGVAGPALARRWTVTGSAEGRGGGPAGRAPRSSRAWFQVSGLGRVRSSTRVSGSKNISVFSPVLMETRVPPRISAAMK